MKLPELRAGVIYWTELYGTMWPFGAWITRVHSETVVDLWILGGNLLPTGDRFKVPWSPTPVSSCWTWEENEQQAKAAA